MTRKELIERVRGELSAELADRQVAAVIEGTLREIALAIQRDGRVVLPGFGTFTVREESPRMGRNPRTGEKFEGHDPKNPIGKFWVGLEGVGESATNTGYGIHGTIDPESIGQQKSMGCVRMGTDDIALVFELMGEQVSTVKIQP